MTNKLTQKTTWALGAETRLGRHHAWEVAAHLAEHEYTTKTGKHWDFEFRKKWLERYFQITPHVVAYEIKECWVCSEEISTALLEGRKPGAQPQAVKDTIRQLTARLGAKAGVRQRHIDRF
jgi:hypothetical protein